MVRSGEFVLCVVRCQLTYIYTHIYIYKTKQKYTHLKHRQQGDEDGEDAVEVVAQKRDDVHGAVEPGKGGRDLFPREAGAHPAALFRGWFGGCL